MIVCHCNVLTSRHIREAVEAASGRDGFSLVTPGSVFRENATRPRCGCCMPHIHKVIEEHLNALPQAGSRETAETNAPDNTPQVAIDCEEPGKKW